MVHCDICNKEIKNINVHNKSNIHIKNMNESNKDNVKKNTLKNRSYYEKVLIKMDVKKNDKPDIIYNKLKSKYSDSSIRSIMRQGFLHQYNDLKPFKLKEFKVFLRDLEDKINKNRIELDKTKDKKTLDDIKSKNRHVQLYLILPLRISTFVNLHIIDNDKEAPKEHTYINISNNELTFINTKTTEYDNFKLKDNVVNFINKFFSDKINDGPVYEKQVNTFSKLLKSLNTNSQEIRKLYSMDSNDPVYSARVLNHTYKVHKGIYEDQ